MPNYIYNKIFSSEYLIHDDFQVMPFIVVNAYPYTSVFAQKFPQKLKTRIHHGQPSCMFQVIVVMLKGASGIIWRVYIDAFHLARIVRKQGLEGFQIVALNEHVLRGAVAVALNFFQKPIGRASGGTKVFFAGKPLQNGHRGISTGRGEKVPENYPSPCRWSKTKAETSCLRLLHPAGSTARSRHWQKTGAAAAASRNQSHPALPMAKKTKKAVSLLQLTACFCCGAPEEIRTPGLPVRSLLLYPAELRARREKLCIAIALPCQTFLRKKINFYAAALIGRPAFDGTT